MKNIVLILLISILVTSNLKSQEYSQKSDKLSDIRLAISLVDYGYKHSSAISLINALNIFIETNTSIKTSLNSRSEINFIDILNKAKLFSEKDSNLLVLITNLEIRLQAIPRGSSKGPYINISTIPANNNAKYEINFYKNKIAEIATIGDGKTDLNVFIYDEHMNLIKSNTEIADETYISFYPKWDGIFTIRIENTGNKSNTYTILVN